LIIPISTTKFRQVSRALLVHEQVRDILLLLAAVNKTKQIDLKHQDMSIFSFYQKPNLHEVANEFNSKDWDYIRGVNREVLMVK
jgi:hypothetical protein